MTQANFSAACLPCKDTGWVSAIHKESYQHYAFQCGMCFKARSLRLAQSIPVWSSKAKLTFERYDEFIKRGGYQEIKDRAEGKNVLPLNLTNQGVVK